MKTLKQILGEPEKNDINSAWVDARRKANNARTPEEREFYKTKERTLKPKVK